MKKFCESLREHAKSIIGFENQKTLSLTKEELRSHQDAFKSINYWKVRDHCLCKGKYRGTAHSICNLKFNVSNEFPVAFHDSSNYDYHFIIKELANKFEGKFECLRENTKKYKTLSFRSCKMFFSSWISTSSSFKKKTEVKLKLICHNAWKRH